MKNLRKAFIALSMVSNFILIASTIIAWITYSTDAGLVIGAFCLCALSISNAVLSLHFKSNEEDLK